MYGFGALIVGAIVAYIVKGLLGEGALSTLISLVIGFIVMGFVASL